MSNYNITKILAKLHSAESTQAAHQIIMQDIEPLVETKYSPVMSLIPAYNSKYLLGYEIATKLIIPGVSSSWKANYSPTDYLLSILGIRQKPMCIEKDIYDKLNQYDANVIDVLCSSQQPSDDSALDL